MPLSAARGWAKRRCNRTWHPTSQHCGRRASTQPPLNGYLNYISHVDPAGRQRAAAEALGELLQVADGVPGPLQ